jgi:hypothetical protein
MITIDPFGEEEKSKENQVRAKKKSQTPHP